MLYKSILQIVQTISENKHRYGLMKICFSESLKVIPTSGWSHQFFEVMPIFHPCIVFSLRYTKTTAVRQIHIIVLFDPALIFKVILQYVVHNTFITPFKRVLDAVS